MFELQAKVIYVHKPEQPELLSDRTDPVSGAAWWHQVLCCKTWCDAAAGRQFAVYSDDLYTASVWLMALAASGKTAVLAPNNQPATQTRLQEWCDGELPSALPTGVVTECSRLSIAPTQSICLFTSGSQGTPTLVTRYWWQLLREAQTLATQFPVWQENDLDVVGTVSHQHIYGLLFRLVLPFCSGLSTQRYRHAFSEQWLHRLEQRPIILISSPAHLRRFDDFDLLEPPNLALRAVFSSGGALPAATAARWQQKNAPAVQEIFGSTETGGIAWRQQVHGSARWQALPGVELQCDDDARLQIRSQHLQPQEWVATSDRVGHIEANSFELAGRIDRIVKIEEKRVSLDEMEAACCKHPWVSECAALSLEATATGRQMIALVVVLNAAGCVQLRSGKRATSDALRTHLEQYFEPVLLPRRIRYVDQLPYTEQGKLPQAQLHELLAS